MKSYYFKGILLSSVVMVLMIACKSKKDDNLEVPLNAKTLAGKYKLTKLTVETAVTPPTDAMGMVEACELDDIYELKADSTASYIDAGVACDPPKNYALDYEVNGNTVSLTGFQNAYFTGGTVKQFDGKTIVLEVKAKGPQTGNIEVTVQGTLTKQP